LNSPTQQIQRFLGTRSDIFVLQIGSNDGLTGDPIRPLLLRNATWKALLVEPVPFLFERLRQNYTSYFNVKFLNAAVSDSIGLVPFYYIDPEAKVNLPELPSWYDKLGSFNRNHISAHFGPAILPYIATTDVITYTLNDLLAEAQVSSIDVLHLDTEGHDWTILRQLDLSKITPSVILFEHKHLNSQDRESSLEFLNVLYRIENLGSDYICLKR
jgi:FkbM family methyltransferase